MFEIWHCVYSQLLADGVPSDRLENFGPLQLATIWSLKGTKQCFWDKCHLEDLPLWQYEPCKDRTVTTTDKRQGCTRGETRHVENTQAADETYVSEVDHAEESFAWPSNDARYRVLGFACPEMFSPPSERTIEPMDTMRIDIKSGPCQLGQHRSSSLRLLTSMMRNHHQNTFSNGPDDATDDEFWTTFFIGGLGKGWHFSDHLILRHRFSWVLEYIRTGSLPAQALSAQRVLREALKGSVLATATHPYNYSLDVVTTTHLNPDLCQEWTRELLTTQANLEKIKADLQQSPESITIEALCSRYGILIPQLWEESTFHFGAPVYSARLTARSPMSNSRLEPMRLDTDPSFDSSSQVAGMSTSAKTDHESQAMCLDADLDITLRIASNSTCQLRKDNPFGLDDAQHVTAHDSRLSTPASPEDRSSSLHHWTSDRCAYLAELVETAEDWGSVNRKFEKRFNIKQTKLSLCKQAQQQGLDISRISDVFQWDSEQDEFLTFLLKEKRPHSKCADALREKFGIDRSTQAIAVRAKHLGLSGITRKWPDEMIKFLEQLQVFNLTLSEKYDRFQDKFDSEYSFSAFHAKVWKLGKASKSAPGPQEGQATVKAQAWLPEQEKFVREWRGKANVLIVAFQEKFPGQRTGAAIRKKWQLLTRPALKQPDSEIAKRTRTVWSRSEDEFIEEWTGSKLSTLVDGFHRRFPNRRTSNGVKCRREQLIKEARNDQAETSTDE